LQICTDGAGLAKSAVNVANNRLTQSINRIWRWIAITLQCAGWCTRLAVNCCNYSTRRMIFDQILKFSLECQTENNITTEVHFHQQEKQVLIWWLGAHTDQPLETMPWCIASVWSCHSPKPEELGWESHSSTKAFHIPSQQVNFPGLYQAGDGSWIWQYSRRILKVSQSKRLWTGGRLFYRSYAWNSAAKIWRHAKETGHTFNLTSSYRCNCDSVDAPSWLSASYYTESQCKLSINHTAVATVPTNKLQHEDQSSVSGPDSIHRHSFIGMMDSVLLPFMGWGQTPPLFQPF